MKKIILLLLVCNHCSAATIHPEDFGAAGDGVTDDSAAFQAAIDALADTGGRIELSNRVYKIDAPYSVPAGLVTGAIAAQLYLPARSLSTQAIVNIEICGDALPALNTIWTGGTNPPVVDHGAILLSTRTATNPLSAMISGAAQAGSIYPLTAVCLTLRRVTVRSSDNPTSTALNLGNVAQADLAECVIDTGQPAGAQSRPTAGGYGVILPGINNWCISRMNNVDVRGFFVGVRVNEHSRIEETRVWLCDTAFEFTGGTHAAAMGHTLVTGCRRGVKGPPAGGWVQRLTWECYAVEHSILSSNCLAGDSTWANSTVDFDDPNNALKGLVNYATVQSGIGADDHLVVTGALKVAFFDVNEGKFQSSRAVADLIGTNTVSQEFYALATTYTNTTSSLFHLVLNIAYNKLKVNGSCSLQVIVGGTYNNTYGQATSSSSTVAESIYAAIPVLVPPGATFRFVNTSTSGNSVTLFNTIKGVE